MIKSICDNITKRPYILDEISTGTWNIISMICYPLAHKTSEDSACFRSEYVLTATDENILYVAIR